MVVSLFGKISTLGNKTKILLLSRKKKERKEGNVKTGLNLHKGCSDCWRWLNVMKINK